MTSSTFVRLLGLALLLAIVVPAGAEETPTPPSGPVPSAAPSKERAPQSTARLPGGVEVEAEKIAELPDSMGYLLEGSVSIRSGASRIQADRIEFRDGRYVEATGDVLVVWGRNRISGERMTYDLEEKRGVLDNAMGQVEPEFFFVSKRAEKIGEDLVVLDDATITTCTQPVPYWSFWVSHAKIRLDHYAHLTNIALRAKKAPIFYLPYLVWPAKRDRAAGLLIPAFGSNQERGRIVSLPLYIPLGPSAEVTLSAQYYSIAGLGGSADVAFIPNGKGVGRMSGFFIRDQVSGTDRYRFNYQETQEFENGFRMVADVNRVSDFDFFNDFERDLKLASSPTILARLELSRNDAWTSLNVRELRREQLLSNGTSQIQETLPEIEWRGRSHRLGKTPFYLSFESSFAAIQQDSVQVRSVGSSDTGYETFHFPLQSDYYRADAYPTISAPFSPVPWLDVTPSVATRYTVWTQHQAATTESVEVGGGTFNVPLIETVDENLTRQVSGAGVEVVGPKIFRIYDRPDSSFSKRYKHVVEPWLAYVYQQAFDRSAEIISYDDVDASRGASNQVAYGIRTRLFAQRPRSKQQAAPGSREAVLLPEGTSGAVRKADDATPDATKADAAAATGSPAAQAPAEPVEIASFEIRQARSFGKNLSSWDTNGDGIPETSRFSSIDAIGRFNPTPTTSLDLRTNYDIVLGKMMSSSLSGNLRGDAARTAFSFVRTASTSPGSPDRTQLRFAGGFDAFGKKLKIDVDGSFDVNERRVPDQRWTLEYYTQCCGFLAEWFHRDYLTTNRDEFRFTVDLRGVGKLLDVNR